MKYSKLILILSCITSLISCDNNSSISSDKSLEIFESKDEKNVLGEYKKELVESKAIGKFIDNIDVFASSYLYDANNIINDSGMSGAESYLHTHTFKDARKNMFITQARQSENYIILTMPNSLQLGHMYIYNLNDLAKIDSSIKEFEILYSSDGINFTKFDNEVHTLSQYSGNNNEKASLIDDMQYIDFKGLTAKYIKINFLSNYGGIYYGLSEIRMYEYKCEAKKGSVINASILKDEKRYTPLKMHYLIDDSGMSDTNSLEATHTNNPYFMSKSSQKEINIDLNGNYPIGKIGIYNYNDPNDLNSGVKEMEILYSIDGNTYSSLGKHTINKASGSENEKVSSIIDCNNINAQYFKFKYLSSYGEKQYGLSEIRFINGSGIVSEPNIEYTGLFSNYDGFTGADGIFACNLDGIQTIGHKNKLMFNFSDTYVGQVDEVTKQRHNYIFRNHTFATYENNKIDFYTDESTIINAIKDENRSNKDAYYWLGDSCVINNKYYVFAHYIAKEGALGFSQKGEDLVCFDIKDNNVILNSKVIIKDESTNRLSFFKKDGSLDIIFGSAIFENTVNAGVNNPDGYIYNFGYMDDRNSSLSRSLVVCRVKEEQFTDFSKYEYLSNEGWVNDILKVKPIIEHVSCEMSFVQINNENSEYFGKYLLTYQKDTIGGNICMAVFDNLSFLNSSSNVIYYAPDKKFINGVSYYNAKMHPALSNKEKYIVSYNLNENGNNLINKNADIYHPRFIEVKKI